MMMIDKFLKSRDRKRGFLYVYITSCITHDKITDKY